VAEEESVEKKKRTRSAAIDEALRAERDVLRAEVDADFLALLDDRDQMRRERDEARREGRIRAEKAERDEARAGLTQSRATVEEYARMHDEMMVRVDELKRERDEALLTATRVAAQAVRDTDALRRERDEAWSSLASTQAQLDLLSVRHQRRETLLEAADATEGEEVAVEALVDDLLAQLAQERLARRRETTLWADERDQMRRERDEARAAEKDRGHPLGLPAAR
jgi:hypothetical protein